ncbi:MAG: periplasmic heavy metal sensor [Bacteroidota bacterium]
MKIDKIKLLTTLVVLLLLINIATIAGIWKLIDPHTLGLMPPPPPSPKEFIISKLNLDEEQQKVFEELRKEHFEQMQGLQEQIREEKDAMYDLLKSANPDTTQTYLHIAKIMQSEERLERITFDHFRKVRAICNEEQQQHFDAIIDQVMRMVMRPPRHGGPNGPHREPGPPEHMPLP